MLRAGFPDYVVNAEALAYMRQRSLAGPVIARLAEHPEQHFADEAAWLAHLERLGITALTVTPDPVRIATEGAVWGSIKAHGLLPDTVILSDDAGQFALDRHALCWVHAERLVHKLDTFTDRQHAAQQLVRALIWFSNRAHRQPREAVSAAVGPDDGGPWPPSSTCWSPHPSLARHHPTDPVSGPASSFLASKAPVPGPWFSPRSARGRRMMGLRASRPSNVVHAVRERPQPNQRNGRTHVPAGTPRRVRRTDASR